MNREFQKIILFLERITLKELPQKAQSDSEYFYEVSRCTLKNASPADERF
jgi:hypothetical protein